MGPGAVPTGRTTEELGAWYGGGATPVWVAGAEVWTQVLDSLTGDQTLVVGTAWLEVHTGELELWTHELLALWYGGGAGAEEDSTQLLEDGTQAELLLEWAHEVCS